GRPAARTTPQVGRPAPGRGPGARAGARRRSTRAGTGGGGAGRRGPGGADPGARRRPLRCGGRRASGHHDGREGADPVSDAADPHHLSPEQKRRMLARLLRQKVAAAQGWEPLSYAQRLYWSLQRAAPPEGAGNNEGFAWRVRADFDVDLLLEVGQELVERHPCLGTTYAEQDGEPAQRFDGSVATRPEIIDATGWPAARLGEEVIAAASRRFD